MIWRPCANCRSADRRFPASSGGAASGLCADETDGYGKRTAVDGRVWPFLGEEKREEVYSECLIETDYEASFRDQEYSYHFKCGYNRPIHEIDLTKEEPILVYKRKNGKITYEEQSISDQEREQLRSKFLDRIRGYVYK